MKHPGKPEAGRSAVPGNPAYEAAMEDAAVLRPRWRRFLSVEGRGPEQMLKGILSGRIPQPLDSNEGPWLSGEVAYSAVLTPRGKMITDLRILPLPQGGFLLDLPAAGTPGALAHFRKFINPRFATVTDRTGELGMLTVVGPRGPEALASALGQELRVPLRDEVRVRSGPGGRDLILLPNGDVEPLALDLVLSLAILEEVRGRLEDRGARAMDADTWDVLRIEAGTPEFGVDMTEDTIPVEAGIQDRAIDYEKGCYTGQEVIIRLRDRGRVNKRMLRLLLGGAEPPGSGTEIFLPLEAEDRSNMSGSGGRNVGWITSACTSPRFGQTVALAFLKRGVEPGDHVAVGDPSGPAGVLQSLP